jgi:polyhydroxyalkanoate synthesis regulator phasin
MARRLYLMIAAILLLAAAARARTEETLDMLKQRADTARVEDRPSLCVDVAERQLKAADQLYTSGKSEEAGAAVRDVVNYSTQATEAATKTGKKLKNTEIALRKMAQKLRDIKRTLAFDDQGPVEAAASRLEALRSQLLKRMFEKKGK